jgi:hypothetical protein
VFVIAGNNRLCEILDFFSHTHALLDVVDVVQIANVECDTQDHYDDQHHNQHPSHEEVGHILQQTKGPRRSFSNKLIAPRLPLGQISANHVHGNNSCHDASKEASIVTTRAPSSKALQFNAGIPKCKVHSVSWKNFVLFFFP